MSNCSGGACNRSTSNTYRNCASACCERNEYNGMPTAESACAAPGGTPAFLALSPLAALKRRAKLTGRLPHGRLCKPVDHCCQIVPYMVYEENVPWQAPNNGKAQHDWRNIGQAHWHSQFRSLNRCGYLQTREACECGDPFVDNCATQCPKKSCFETHSVCTDQHCEECCQCSANNHAPKCDGNAIKRKQFRVNSGLLRNPSGSRDNEGGLLQPRARPLLKPESQSEQLSHALREQQVQALQKFQVAQPSRRFRGNGNPEGFCNSIRCKFASGQQTEKGVAICGNS